MKTYILGLIMLCSIQAFGQNEKYHIFKLETTQLAFSTIGITYEWVIPEVPWSVQLRGSYTQHSATLWEGLHPKLSGFGGEIQVRRYFEEAERYLPNGAYVGAYGKYVQRKIALTIPAGTIRFLDGNSKIVGVLLGYQHGFLKDFLFLDATLGAGYHFADYSGRFSERGRLLFDIISNGLTPKLNIAVGFTF